MAKVLITGAAGFLGSHLCNSLLRNGHSVIGIDNLIGGYYDNVPKGVDFYRHDCCAARRLGYLMAGVDVVYHCAATPHEGLSVFSPRIITKNTYLSTVTMASEAIKARVKRFVFTSSMARYGKGVPITDVAQWPYCDVGGGKWMHVKPDFSKFTEDMPTIPVDPYGIAKVASEQTLLCLGKVHGMEVVIAVPHNIIGPRQKYNDPYRNVVSIFINRMLLGKQPIIYGDGLQKRCFSYIDDCVEPLLKMGFQEGLDGEVINIGPDDDVVTILDVARAIAFRLDFELQPIFVADRPCEVKVAYPSADKARRLLGYEPKTKFGYALDRIIAYIQLDGPKEFVYHLPVEIVSDKTPTTWKNKTI
jgi:UDP-glucose 4-epimerase